MKINSVVIVGGGSSGWMTATAFVRCLPNIKLTLIESPSIPTIGVGESTLGQIREYVNMIGLRDEEWMADCNATYKTSIKFTDFRENPKQEPHSFHYPFGKMFLKDKPFKHQEWFIMSALYPEQFKIEKFADYYHDSVLMTDQGKLTHNKNNNLTGFQFDYDTAFHMDAALFGQWLKDNICIPSGMTYIVDECKDFIKEEDGNLTHIKTEKSGDISADLYIDCTGFRSLILENVMGVEFESFHDTLKNDRAVATIIPYLDKEKEMESVTNCTAIDNGWVWNIPLWNRIGTGYVYSSKYATEEQAEQQFRKYLASNRMKVVDANRAAAAKLRHIKIRHGVHKKTYEKNVVGIGLSNGFIEPLESTGLLLTHMTVVKLVSALKSRDCDITQFDKDMLNYSVYTDTKTFKDFVSQHYALTKRDDTQYWRDCKESTNYSPALENPLLHPMSSYCGLANALHKFRDIEESAGGIIYILAGMGYNPTNKYHIDYIGMGQQEEQMLEVLTKNWDQRKEEKLSYIKELPSHYEFLKQTHYKNKD